MSGWGTGPWGTGPWGALTPHGPPVSVTSVYAISTNEVQVTASGPLLQRSPVLPGDATNPSTWRVVRGDTNTIVPVVAITMTAPNIAVLRTLFTLPVFGVTLTLYAPNLLDSFAVSVSGLPATFPGVTEEAYSTPQQSAVTMTGAAVDLLNRQTPASDGSLTGTLIVKDGDYRNQFGTDLLRKLIIRRIITRPGDFFHLPTYGVGVRVKQPLPGGDMLKLKAAIIKQIQLEPNVDNVNVTLTQTANLLTIAVSVTVKPTGERLDVGVPLQLQGG